MEFEEFKKKYLENIGKKINMEELQNQYAEDESLIAEIISVAMDVALHPQRYYRIRSASYTPIEVIKRLNKLSTNHILYVTYQIKHVKQVIQYRSGYILSTLFTSTEHTEEGIAIALDALKRANEEKNL